MEGRKRRGRREHILTDIKEGGVGVHIVTDIKGNGRNNLKGSK